MEIVKKIETENNYIDKVEKIERKRETKSQLSEQRLDSIRSKNEKYQSKTLKNKFYCKQE